MPIEVGDIQKVMILLEHSRDELAERELRRLVLQDPHDGWPHAMLASVLARQDRLGEALHEAQEAVRLSPDHDVGYYWMANIQLRLDQLKEAEMAIRRAVELDPNDAANFAAMSSILAARGRWDESRAAAEQGLAIDPEHHACRLNRTEALEQLGRHDEAVEDIRAVLARNPEDDMAHCNLGWALLRDGKPDEAANHFREALRLDPRYEYARAGLIESLKSRHRLYSLLLRMLLATGRWPAWVWVVGFVGYFVLLRVLRAVTRDQPFARVAVSMLSISVMLLIVVTIAAGPLLTLVMRTRREDRRTLSPEQLAASNWQALLLLLAMACFALWPVMGIATAMLGAFLLVYLTVPVNEAYSCPGGAPRRWMAAYTVALALLGTITILARVPDVAIRAILWAHVPLALWAAIVLNSFWLLLLVALGCYMADHVASWLTRRHHLRQRPRALAGSYDT
jgi:Flp pilus assembly protein TadD